MTPRRSKHMRHLDSISEISPAEKKSIVTILTARIEAGLTQLQVANRMGTTQSAVARMESNLAVGKLPSLVTLEKYAAAVGKRVEVRFV